MVSKRSLRIVLAGLLAVSVLVVGYGLVAGASETRFESYLTDDGDVDREAQIAPEAGGITVVATDSNSWRGERSEGPRARAELVAFDPDGTVLYYNDTHTRYWDVDPVPGTDATVEYGYADHLEGEECPDWEEERRRHAVDEQRWNEYRNAHGDVDACTRNGFERVNLTTGEVTHVWSRYTPGKPGTRYHDIDRINGTHIAVADIYLDRVFVANTETDRIEWQWNASEAFAPERTGDTYPEDWTHVNDVEVLEDGRLMASVRNHDQVVFIDREDGLQADWTLGAENDYSILYEQHNPDYVPEENGGPAVIVADSENNRLVEYQRENGAWTRTWQWRDGRLQWPRDADRLPDGHTLITDSNGNRVFEVDDEGEVVWSVNVAFPYEAERLGTGDESEGGPSAASAGVESHAATGPARLLVLVKEVVPGRYLNGLMYVTPVWLGLSELLGLTLGAITALVWGGFELKWAWSARRRGEPADGTPEARDASDEPPG